MKKTNQNGQAFIETLAVVFLVTALGFFVAGYVTLLATRIHLLFVAQELAACSVSLVSKSQCQIQANRQAEKILRLWGVQNGKARSSIDQETGSLFIQGSIPFSFSKNRTFQWMLQQPLPFQKP